MSREILAFGGFSLSSIALLLAASFDSIRHHPTPICCLATVAALTAVFCSAMIYIDTRRPFWAAASTLPRFFGATLVLGATAGTAFFTWPMATAYAGAGHAALAFGLAAIVLRVGGSSWEMSRLFRAFLHPEDVNHKSAFLIWHQHRRGLAGRITLDLLSTALTAVALTANPETAVACALIALLTTFFSCVLERYLFFVAVVALRMPGAVSA
jgi:DMSO reductase anchor subunit